MSCSQRLFSTHHRKLRGLARTGAEPYSDCLQVAIHTDEDDGAALFLYRKLITEPIEPPVLITGPPVEASDAHMQVSASPNPTVTEVRGREWLAMHVPYLQPRSCIGVAQGLRASDDASERELGR